nr:hydrogenase maturation nickel metallochaperone HypA [Methylomarinum sp. Ch1-1]MDP4522154.1 hydrogenase maturation nickel metallochaperone HypA [Methylomarinum sp. Ch1-1]
MREILQQQARRQHFSRVRQVTLDIGKLSCVEPEALRFAFDVVMKDTLAEDAVLVISVSEGIGVCQNCNKRMSLESLHEPCRHCAHPFVNVIEGADMKIKDLLVV